MVEHDKKIYCNACGKQLGTIPKANVCKEHLSVQKEWGYFSGKDFMIHSFTVCEQCYDEWIGTFAIPVQENIQTEWACTLPEEALDLEKEEPRQ